MIKLIAILILICSSQIAYSQSLDSMSIFRPADSLLIDFKVDALNNLWYIYSNKIIRKSNDKHYSDSFMNKILSDKTIIDTKLPLKTLFFNPYINQVYIVNSRWGVLNTISLDELGLYQPEFVCYGYDEYIWSLDQTSNQLIKFNDQGQVIFQVKNPFVIQEHYFFPDKFVDFVYYEVAVDTSYGLFIIDNYGKLIDQYPVNGILDAFVIDKNLYIHFLNNKTAKVQISPKENRVNLVYTDLLEDYTAAYHYANDLLLLKRDKSIIKMPYRHFFKNQ